MTFDVVSWSLHQHPSSPVQPLPSLPSISLLGELNKTLYAELVIYASISVLITTVYRKAWKYF